MNKKNKKNSLSYSILIFGTQKRPVNGILTVLLKIIIIIIFKALAHPKFKLSNK